MDADTSTADLPPAPAAHERPTLTDRCIALLEVLLCSDYPTQFVVASTLIALGFRATRPDGSLDILFVILLSFADTALLIALMGVFLVAHGDRPRELFLGSRPVLSEARAGLPLIPAVLMLAVISMVTLRRFFPQLHDVERNPLQDVIRSSGDASMFALVVVVAGGVREELQRAFLMNRFERWLGGGAVGVIVASAAFGVGHRMQGGDAAVTTAVLGAFWAIVYLRRRSVIAPVVSHSGFNLLQLAQLLVFGR
jgi:membrane protease YdiL (CAAX protease family)